MCVVGGLGTCGTSRAGCSSSCWWSCCRRCSRSACCGSSRATSPTRSCPSARRSRSSSSSRTTVSTSRSSSSTPTWLGNLLQGDLGKDYQSNTPVIDKLEAALPVSLQLMLYAQILALLVAIPLGVLTAYRANTKTDRSINAGAFALLALPSFVLALALAYFVGVKWQPDIPFLGQIPGHRLRAGLARAAVRPTQRRHRRALRHVAPPRDLARGGPDRGVHAAAAQRHDRDAPGELHHDGAARRACPTAASCGGTRSVRRASPCSRWPASTSAR